MNRISLYKQGNETEGFTLPGVGGSSMTFMIQKLAADAKAQAEKAEADAKAAADKAAADAKAAKAAAEAKAEADAQAAADAKAAAEWAAISKPYSGGKTSQPAPTVVVDKNNQPLTPGSPSTSTTPPNPASGEKVDTISLKVWILIVCAVIAAILCGGVWIYRKFNGQSTQVQQFQPQGYPQQPQQFQPQGYPQQPQQFQPQEYAPQLQQGYPQPQQFQQGYPQQFQQQLQQIY